ncbi:MAG: hypothetical protein JSV49_00035 [Thermoplasmata archaeon]|nr:MAG: hypothetical protein JSV49_00035 [Thermoplasmata archaeon]
MFRKIIILLFVGLILISSGIQVNADNVEKKDVTLFPCEIITETLVDNDYYGTEKNVTYTIIVDSDIPVDFFIYTVDDYHHMPGGYYDRYETVKNEIINPGTNYIEDIWRYSYQGDHYEFYFRATDYVSIYIIHPDEIFSGPNGSGVNYSKAKYSESTITNTGFTFTNPDEESYKLVVNNSNNHDVTINYDILRKSDALLNYKSKAKYVQEDMLRGEINFIIPDDQSYMFLIDNFNNKTATIDYEFGIKEIEYNGDGGAPYDDSDERVEDTGPCYMAPAMMAVTFGGIGLIYYNRKR